MLATATYYEVFVFCLVVYLAITYLKRWYRKARWRFKMTRALKVYHQKYPLPTRKL